MASAREEKKKTKKPKVDNNDERVRKWREERMKLFETDEVFRARFGATKDEQALGFQKYLVTAAATARCKVKKIGVPGMQIEAHLDDSKRVLKPTLVMPAGSSSADVTALLDQLAGDTIKSMARVAHRLHRRGFDKLKPADQETVRSSYFAAEFKRAIGCDPDQCAQCGLVGTRKQNLLACTRCSAVLYCSKPCQKAHWKKEHNAHCKPVA